MCIYTRYPLPNVVLYIVDIPYHLDISMHIHTVVIPWVDNLGRYPLPNVVLYIVDIPYHLDISMHIHTVVIPWVDNLGRYPLPNMVTWYTCMEHTIPNVKVYYILSLFGGILCVCTLVIPYPM